MRGFVRRVSIKRARPHRCGPARAARIIDQIEERGIIGPSEGSKPRQILITKDEWQQMKLRRHDRFE